MIKKSNYCLLSLLLILCCSAIGQDFKVTANLDPVPVTGFYKILVTPELTAYSKADFADIRVGEKGVADYKAYLIRTHQPAEKPTNTVRTLEINSNVTEKNYSTIILESPDNEMVTGISLVMNNTAVERFASVSGSNDNVNWYIIDDHILLVSSGGTTNGTYAQEINFPSIAYKYFKLKINNAHTDPLLITAAKAFSNPEKLKLTQDMQPNPAPTITHKDSSNHISYVTIHNNAPYLVSQVKLTVVGSKFFDRNMTVFVMSSDKDSSALNYPVGTFSLSSARPAVFTVAAQNAKNIVLQIENKDDVPLKIVEATTLQAKQYLISWLEQGKEYFINTGDEHATAPHYDLSRFTDSIPAELPIIAFGAFSPVKKLMFTPNATNETHTYWIWIIIVISVAVLGWLTFRLMKDMKQ